MRRTIGSNPKRKPKLRPLHVESLENRYALDGNLTAFVQNGILFVFGDEEGNVAELSSSASGEITVTGIGTTVNDGVEPVTFTGVRSVVVHLKDGDDQLTISNGEPNGETGGEIGIQQVAPVDIERQLIVTGGRGDDILNISANVGWGMCVGAGLGDDVVNVLDTNVQRGAGIHGAGGNDTIAVTASSFKALGIAGWGGNDVIALTAVTAGNVLVDAGSGDDTLTMDEVHVNDLLFAQMSLGNDALTVTNSSAALALFFGGPGTDTIVNGPGNNFDNESESGF